MDWYFIVLIILGAILSSVLIFSLYSRIKYKRSLMASLAEIYLKLTEKEYTLATLPLINDKKYILPKNLIFDVSIDEYEFLGMQVFNLNIESQSNKAIIYLHGSGYVRNPRKWHFRFVNKLAKKSGLPLYMPIYPKAPNHTYKESYDKLTSLYLKLKEKYQDIILIGDSAGGGLALGLAESFISKNILQPKELILLSPWVDINLSNTKIKEYQKVDPIVFASNEKIWGKSWAGDENLNNYKVSPIYGNMIGLNSVSLFIGTREVLYPDTKLLESILKDSNVKVKMFIGEGLNHVYPIYPIPEAKIALKQILNIINN